MGSCGAVGMQGPGAFAPVVAASVPADALPVPRIASALAQLQRAIERLRTVVMGTAGVPAPTASVLDAVAGVASSHTAPSVSGPAAAPSTTAVASPITADTVPSVPKPRARRVRPGSFHLATFNVLGASHTDPGGNKRGYRTGVSRTEGAVRTLRRHGVDVAGMQEFQPSQQRRFRELAPEYGVYAQADNAVVWRADRFRRVRTTSLSIPYFDGHPKRMPAVLLEDRSTGARTWVLSVHNPADTADHHNQGAFRAEALRREQAFVRRLEASGTPVYVVGDFNAHDPARQAMGSVGMSSSTRAGDDTKIDWLFGSTGTRFYDSTTDTAPQRDRTSDHPIVVARASLG